MADKKEHNSGKDKDDEALWAAAMRDVARLAGKAAPKPGKKNVRIREQTVLPKKEKEREAKGAVKGPAKGRGVDARTDEKLRRGKFEIEARVDLHGLRRDEAQARLAKVLLRSHAQGKRCVLVITGKGERHGRSEEAWWEDKPGVLREAVPQWLGQAPLADIVLQTHPAAAKDGGAGAIYVLLRRKREI